MSSVIRPDLNLVIQLYKASLPDYDYLLRKSTRLVFSERLQTLTSRFNCQNYPQLYQDENRIQSSLFRAFFESDEKIREYLQTLDGKPPEELTRFVNDHIAELVEIGDWLEARALHIDALDWSPRAIAIAELRWQKIPEAEQQQIIRFRQYGLMFALSSFHNYLALMVHGRKLTQLVKEAMNGDEDAFCLAVYIDKAIIKQIPFFSERYAKALELGEDLFLAKIHRRLAEPQLKGKIRHRLLYLLFSLLESTNWLSVLKHREILDLCDELGMDKYQNRIETENALTKRLLEYRSFQKFNSMSMP